MKITLVLHNIRSIYNVGAILRTAEGLGVEAVALSGYTPRYHDPQALPHLREKLDRQISKSALGAEEIVPQLLVDDLPAWLQEQAAKGRLILGLENNLDSEESARKLLLGSAELRKVVAAQQRPAQELILVLGEEVHGIPPEVREHCGYFLEIPMVGRKESFNVSVATGIALWGLKAAA